MSDLVRVVCQQSVGSGAVAARATRASRLVVAAAGVAWECATSVAIAVAVRWIV